MTTPPPYLSPSSANALISELRPTTLSPPALNHINSLLDELLYSLLSGSQSLNPKDLRLRGVPAVFSTSESTGLRAFGRSAVGEAELELRSWYEGHPFARKSNVGFPPDGKGQGLVATRNNSAFPLTQAVALLRLKCVALSTLAPQTPPSKTLENSASSIWRSAGGDASEETVAPAALWLTAIIEHVCERILSHLSRVVSRDSSVSVAGEQELYVALCEDDAVWGLFKRMRVKESLEGAIRPNTKRLVQQSSNGRESPASPQASRVSLGGSREASIDSGSRTVTRDSSDFSRTAGISGGPPRKLTKGPANGGHQRVGSVGNHQRSSSVLSVNSPLGTFGDSVETERSTRSPQEDEDEFDALVRSGETMKVSLTPSRLKTFEATTGRSSPLAARKSHSTPPTAESMPNDTISSMIPSSTSTRSGLGPRSASSRLQARGAATIEENEEEDAAGSSASRKQSLVEVLNNEPAPEARPSDRRGSTPRTAPAVVLGTPPPAPHGNIPTHSPPLVNRPNREPEDEDDLQGVRKIKPKTSSQEMADFFNNTPAPPSTTPTPVATKNKGLRTFMSKVTGKKKEDDTASTPTLSHSRLYLPLGEAIPPRQQKSLIDLASAPNPSAAYEHDYALRLPNRNLLRKRSHDSALAVTADSSEAPVEAAEQKSGFASSSPAEAGPSTPRPENLPAVVTGSDPPSAQEPEEKHLTPTRDRLSPASPQLSEPSQLSPSLTSAEPTAKTPTAEAPDIMSPFYHQSGEAVSASSMSDGNSFRTAEEGEDGVEDEASVQDTDTATEVGPFASVPPSNGLATPDSPRAFDSAPREPGSPSFLLNDLVPLRNLLQHATSATECRLLLSSILTQWGVPHLTHDSSAAESPESRVTAWLLAGRDGPEAGITPSSSDFSKLDDEVVTPTIVQAARLQTLPTVATIANGKDEGMLASASRSETTLLSDDDLQNGEMQSFVKNDTIKHAEARGVPAVADRTINGRTISAGN